MTTRQIKIKQCDATEQALGMAKYLLEAIDAPYEDLGLNPDGNIYIEYKLPTSYTHSSRLEKRIYEKWAATGFIDGLELPEARLLSEIFEDLAVHLLINPRWNDESWQTMIFPVIRKVFSAIGNTDRINLDIKLFVDKFIEYHDSHQDAVSKVWSYNSVDIEAELAVLISEQLIDDITNS